MTINSTEDAGLLERCRKALREEAEAITAYADALSEEFPAALRLLRDARPYVLVAGIGKSGHVARKIASTLCSIGRTAVFLHPSEASHGDLGLVGAESVALILSHSGETEELSDLLHYCGRKGTPIIALTAHASSTLSQRARIRLNYGDVREVCPNGLAPTTSTTLMLAVGDALAVGLMELLRTTPDDFRQFHPGGRLGARLRTVGDLMHTGEALPLVAPETPMQEVVIAMSAKGFGVALVQESGKITGIITDGDMRRNADRLWQSKAGDLIRGRPHAISPETLASTALEWMSAKGITSLVVENQAGELVGLIHIHDCVHVR